MRLIGLSVILLLGVAGVVRADERGDVDVQSTSPREILSGPGRKLHSGEIVTLAVSGQVTQHDERHETHCKIDNLFCDDVTIPDPHSYGPSFAPVEVDFVQEGTGTQVLSAIVAQSPVQVTIPSTVAFDVPVLLTAYIQTGGNRSISTGRYSLSATIVESGRVDAFQAYLAAAPRTEDRLRPVDVINDRLRECCASQVAIAIANHADARFSADSAKRENLLRFALSVDPQNQTVLDHLAALLIQTGNFTGAMQIAKQAINAASDDGDKAMGYLRLASATEEQWAGLNRGSLEAAVSYYHQADSFANSSNLRAAQLQALIGSARVLMKTRTRPGLNEAIKLLDKARNKAPVELNGYYSGFSPDGNYILTVQPKSGFSISGFPESPFFPADYDRWTPLGVSNEQDRLLIESEAGIGWWDRTNGLVPLTTTVFSEVAIGKQGILGRTIGNDISLLPVGGITKVIHKIAPPAAPGAPFHPAPVPDFAIARRASVIAWVADDEAINVERFDGTSLRRVAVGAAEDVVQIALSADGARFAAVVRNAASTSVRMWNVNDNGPALELKQPDGGLLSPKVWARPHAISFSPDGHHVVLSDNSAFTLVNVQTGIQESSTSLQFGPSDSVGHVWSNDTHLIVFTPTFTEHLAYRYASESGSITSEQLDLSTMVFPTPSSPFGTYSGPLLLKGTQEWVVRPAVRGVFSVWSPSGSKVHSTQLDIDLAFSPPVLITAGGGYLVTVVSPSSLEAVDLQTNEKVSISSSGWPFLVSTKLQDEWQVAERNSVGDVVKIRQFKGFTETGHYDVPNIDPAIRSIFTAIPPGGVPPANAQPQPNWGLLSQIPFGDVTQTYLVPFGWEGLFWCAQDNSVAMPVITLAGNLPTGPTGRFVPSCSNAVALSEQTKQVLYSSAPGNPSVIKLSHISGESGGTATDLFSSVTAPWPVFFGSFGEHSIVAGYVSTVSHTGEVRVWSNDPLGPTLRPCRVCGTMNATALNDYSMSLFKQPWLPRSLVSMTGKSFVLPVGDHLIVQDVEQDTLRFRLSIRLPLAVTDSSLLTLSKDKKVRLWLF
jgi:tetratricopeptide (TPR) repeat protein